MTPDTASTARFEGRGAAGDSGSSRVSERRRRVTHRTPSPARAQLLATGGTSSRLPRRHFTCRHDRIRTPAWPMPLLKSFGSPNIWMLAARREHQMLIDDERRRRTDACGREHLLTVGGSRAAAFLALAAARRARAQAAIAVGVVGRAADERERVQVGRVRRARRRRAVSRGREEDDVARDRRERRHLFVAAGRRRPIGPFEQNLRRLGRRRSVVEQHEQAVGLIDAVGRLQVAAGADEDVLVRAADVDRRHRREQRIGRAGVIELRRRRDTTRCCRSRLRLKRHTLPSRSPM